MPCPTLLLTRPLAQSQRFADQLRGSLGDLPILISPVLEIRSLVPVIPRRSYAALVLTSENAVAVAAGLMEHESRLLPRQAYCVGRRTAESARNAGFDAIWLGGDARGMIAELLTLRLAGPLLYLHGQEADLGPWKSLTDGGIETVFSVCYHQVSQELSAPAKAALRGPDPVVLPVFSGRSAGYLLEQGPFAAPLWIAAISDTVGRACAALAPDRLVLAERPDAAGMIGAIGGILRHWQP